MIVFLNKFFKSITPATWGLNYNPISLAIAWVSYHEGITSPIISARNLEQLQPCLDSLNIELTDIVYQKINDITRTPPPATDRIEEVN